MPGARIKAPAGDMPYRYVVDCEVAEAFLRLSNRQREELITAFRAIAGNPFLTGERTFTDTSGREVQRCRFGRWAVAFWADHPVKEVRIVGVQRVVN